MDINFENMFNSIKINKIDSSNINKAYNYILEKCGITENETIDYNKLFYNVIHNNPTSMNVYGNSKMFSEIIDIEINLKDELKNFIEKIKNDILNNNNEDKITYTIKDTNETISISTEQLIDKNLIFKLKQYEEDLKNFISNFNLTINHNNLESEIQNFITNFKKIYENLFLNYDDKLNLEQLKKSIENIIISEYQMDKDIENLKIDYSEDNINNLENKLLSFKYNIEEQLNIFKNKIIEYYRYKEKNEFDNALICYGYIFSLQTEIFRKKLELYEKYTNQEEEKNLNSNNLKNLKKEYQNLLNMICLKNENTINEEKLLNNLIKFNIINNNFEITKTRHKIKDNLTKNFSENFKILLELTQNFEENFDLKNEITDIFSSINKNFMQNKPEENDFLLLSDENLEIKQPKTNDYNDNYKILNNNSKKIENNSKQLKDNSKIKDNNFKEIKNNSKIMVNNREFLIKKIEKGLINLNEKIKDIPDENITSFDNLTNEELNKLNDLMSKLEKFLSYKSLNNFLNASPIIISQIFKEKEKEENEKKEKKENKKKKNNETKRKKKRKKEIKNKY